MNFKDAIPKNNRDILNGKQMISNEAFEILQKDNFELKQEFMYSCQLLKELKEENEKLKSQLNERTSVLTSPPPLLPGTNITLTELQLPKSSLHSGDSSSEVKTLKAQMEKMQKEIWRLEETERKYLMVCELTQTHGKLETRHEAEDTTESEAFETFTIEGHQKIQNIRQINNQFMKNIPFQLSLPAFQLYCEQLHAKRKLVAEKNGKTQNANRISIISEEISHYNKINSL